MPSTAIDRLEQGYVAGLGLGLSSIRELVAAGLLCFGLTHCCRFRKQAAGERQWRERLREAPANGSLAVAVIKLNHEGETIAGIDRPYTHKGIAWGHRFTTSSLVCTDDRDPYMVRADPAPSARMATNDYA